MSADCLIVVAILTPFNVFILGTLLSMAIRQTKTETKLNMLLEKNGISIKKKNEGGGNGRSIQKP